MKLWTAAACLVIAASARGEVRTRAIDYRQGETALQGFLAYDDAATGRRPGALIVHEWWGLNQHARNQAVRLAKAGYVAFALDMYGKGKVATHPADAQAFMQQVTQDPKLIEARFDAALGVLKRQPEVDPKKIAAIGYCFGGTVALAMARAGADLGAVATFHSGVQLPSVPPEKNPPKVKPAILVQTGGADPMAPPERVAALERQMKDDGDRVEVITYPGAKHAFTNPDADKVGMEALRYDPDADRKSWSALLVFLKQVFGT